MTSSMILAVLAISLSCLLTAVTSSPLGPVQPAISLSKMEPDHACLFMCNICFPDLEDTGLLLDCSNKVCGPIMAGMCAMEKLVWLGHNCRQYDMVQKMWAPHGAL
ncbi:uncharacterized protein LOC101854331 [Aplysia californica]|uniref:Clionin-like peptide n=1 Tax=Aplysia californica TaxID=6500 RepID=A0A161A1T8_APLCA|nr:uncharacterized protein LOC101854331 [Aplysia californica]ACN32210.1 clionin-like peptide [Aplysia californica]